MDANLAMANKLEFNANPIDVLIEKYKNEHLDYEIHVVDKIFGKGNLLIQFNYREPFLQFKQCYLAIVDEDDWYNDNHAVMQEVEDCLVYSVGVVYKEDFADDELKCCDESNNHHCENHEKEFDEWFKNQFPKIDLEYGGVAFFDSVLS